MEQMQQLLDSAWEMVVNNYLEVIAAIVILVVGRVVAGWSRRLTRRGLERGNVDPTLVPFVAKMGGDIWCRRFGGRSGDAGDACKFRLRRDAFDLQTL